MRHKLKGLFPGTFHSNLQPRTPLPLRLRFPSNQICSDKNYNLKTQTRIKEAKTYGGLSWHIPL